MKQLFKDHNVKEFLHRHPQALAYIFLVLVTIIGFWRIESQANDLKAERSSRTLVVCNAVNENKDVVRYFTDVLIQVSRSTPTTVVMSKEQIEQREKATTEFLKLLEPKLKHIDCKAVADDPTNFLQSTTTVVSIPPTTIK